MSQKSIMVDGVKYVPEDQNKPLAKKVKGLEYVLVRTYSAGVHVGYLKREEGKEVDLIQSRRIWYWDGAFTLSKLATDGTSKPENCKFSCVAEEIRLKEAIEVIPITAKAQESIESVKEHQP